MKIEPMHKGLLKAVSSEFPNLVAHNDRLYAGSGQNLWSLPVWEAEEGHRVNAGSLAQALKAISLPEYPVEISAEGVLTTAQDNLKGAVEPEAEEKIDFVKAMDGLQISTTPTKIIFSLEALRTMVAVMAGAKENYITLSLGALPTDPVEAEGDETGLKGIIMPCRR